MLYAETVFIYCIPIYLLLFILWIVYKKKPTTILFNTLFYFYIVAVISVTLLPLPIDQSTIETSKSVGGLDVNNYIPFMFVEESLFRLTPVANDPFPYEFRVQMVIRQVGGNILLGMPFGFLAPLVWEKINTFPKALFAGFLFSLGIETTQFLISMYLGYFYRVIDVDDLILNTIGAALGYVCFKLFLPLLRKLKLVEKNEKPTSI